MRPVQRGFRLTHVATLADWSTVFADLSDRLLAPLRQVDWSDGRGFWLGVLLDDRFLVAWAIPFTIALLMIPPRYLRQAIVAGGLAFLVGVFGVLYAGFWILLVLGLHRLSEVFAREVRRTDVAPWAPPLAAGAILTGGYFASFFIARIPLPEDWNAWLYQHVPWVFPLGLRGLGWEPDWRAWLPAELRRGPPPLLASLFWNPHNIGTAYVAIRMLHYFSEIRRGTLPPERRSRLNFVSYLCYAPALMQGPIERFDRFHDELSSCASRRGWHQLSPALARIALGYFKSLVSTVYFMPLMRSEYLSGRYWQHPEQIESTWFLYFGPYIHILWLYLEFSGYCDISAGLGRLLGYRQVENFAMPWIARSLREFWRRWHISLSTLLRDYIYIPLGGNRGRVTLHLCVTFALIGIWHAPQLQLLAWGFLMGAMLSLNQRWVAWMKHLDEQPAARLAHVRRAWLKLRPLPQLLSWALTQHCFAHSLLLFFGGNAIFSVTAELLRRLAAALGWGG